jgi:hypothetical protein
MRDPRDSRFYKLRKRDPSQLTAQEARDVQATCERMMEYVSDGKTRKEWEKLAEEYSAVASRLREDAP